MMNNTTTITYTTNHRNVARVTSNGRTVTMTTLEVHTCLKCGSRTYVTGDVLSRRPIRRSITCC